MGGWRGTGQEKKWYIGKREGRSNAPMSMHE